MKTATDADKPKLINDSEIIVKIQFYYAVTIHVLSLQFQNRQSRLKSCWIVALNGTLHNTAQLSHGYRHNNQEHDADSAQRL